MNKVCLLCENKIENRFDLNCCVLCAKKVLLPVYDILIENKVAAVIDETGTVWYFGRWYGEVPHFRCKFGAFSESVLCPVIAQNRTFSPYIENK